MQRKWWWLLLVLLGFSLALVYFWPQPPIQVTEKTELWMDTVVRIVILDQDQPDARLNQALTEAFHCFARVESLASTTIPTSEIAQINSHAGVQPITVTPVLQALMDSSLFYADRSHGAFDCSIFPVLRLWNFATNDQAYRKPDSTEIRAKLKFVDYRKIQLEAQQIYLPAPGQGIDLGAIAKGYAVDLAFEKLRALGLKDFLIDAGGNLRFASGPVSAGKRRIWIKHPRIPAAVWGYLKLDQGGVATSGDYERYFLVDSVRYHHILDPRTGYPAHDCISVTIIAPSATQADALSTAVFVLGRERGMQFVNTWPDVAAIILYLEQDQLKYLVSERIRDKLVIENKTIAQLNL
ncbi:FAD:protein FMN transferase [candidate division KSB1 bacterium]|nr:FAD:protein FMN transferase [candidate division KSB1 bacterium]